MAVDKNIYHHFLFVFFKTNILDFVNPSLYYIIFYKFMVFHNNSLKVKYFML